jgi:hypothetical protein
MAAAFHKITQLLYYHCLTESQAISYVMGQFPSCQQSAQNLISFPTTPFLDNQRSAITRQ